MKTVNRLDKEDLHLQVKRLIEEYVQKNAYPLDGRLPTYREFAEMANVSTLTVQRAVQLLIEEGVCYARRGCGTFLRKPIGSPAISIPDTGTYACLIPAAGQNTLTSVIFALDAQLFDATGKHMLLCNSRNGFDHEVQLLDSLLKRGIDALIYQQNPTLARFPIYLRAVDHRLEQFLAKGTPVIAIDDFPIHGKYDTVMPDKVRRYQIAVQHLIDLGHRRILFVGNEHLQDFQSGKFTEALNSMDCKGSEFRIELNADAHPAVLAAMGINRALEDGWPFTAIVAPTDAYAIGCYETLRSKGITVPDQVSIIGGDNLQQIERVDLPLTTVWCRPEIVSEQIGKLVSCRLAEGSESSKLPPQAYMIEPELLDRGSCSRPPAEQFKG